MQGEALIELKNVAKSYKRGEETLPIFSDLTLTIPQGDFVAVMGPSGSGKTTLLNVLGGLDRPSSGAIRFAGENIENLSVRPELRMIGHTGFLTFARKVEQPIALQEQAASDPEEETTDEDQPQDGL